MITCEICREAFRPCISSHYLTQSTSGNTITTYDTFDCPFCGCQNTVQERAIPLTQAEDPPPNHQSPSSERPITNNKPSTEPDSSSFNQVKVLSEDDFIRIIDDGDQESLSVGTIVHLDNILSQNNLWQVAGINHDGTSGTVDLVSAGVLVPSTMIGPPPTVNKQLAYGKTNVYQYSNIREYLIDEYINGFSNKVRSRLKTMKVTSETHTNGIRDLEDKIKIPSMNELGISNDVCTGLSKKEGPMYPVFISGESDDANEVRIMKNNKNIASAYWTRSSVLNSSGKIVYGIGENGAYFGNDCRYENLGIVSIIRF